MDDRIASVLEDTFPDREATDLLPIGPSWNEKNRTVGIEFADGTRIYLKVATDGDGSRIARERAVLAYAAANTDVPVPEVVASDPEWSIPHLVTVPVAGPNLIELWAEADTSEQRDSLIRSAVPSRAFTPAASSATVGSSVAARRASNSIPAPGRPSSRVRSPKPEPLLPPIVSRSTSNG